MTFPSTILVEEHKLIKRMLAVVNKAADQLEAGNEVAPETFMQTVDFISKEKFSKYRTRIENAVRRRMDRTQN